MRIQRFSPSMVKMFIGIVVGLFLFSPIGYAADEPEYLPDEIIVKFRAEVADTLERKVIQERKALSEISLTAPLDVLNRKYRVKRFKPIFKDFKEDKKRLETLKYRDYLKETYNLKQIRFTKKERHLLRRLKRAPKDAEIPDLDRIYKLELEEGQSVEEAVAEYSKDPYVEYAQPNYIYKLYATPLPPEPYIPNDYYIEDDLNPGYWREGSWGQDYPDLWGLGGEQTGEGWRYGIQAIEACNFFDTDGNGIIDGDERLPGEGVVVAVIDTGVDYDHEDLHANIWQNDGEIPGNGLDDDENGYVDDIRGYDISDGDNDASDHHGHGTHTSGTIAAMGDNTVGIIGVAYGAMIMPVKIFPSATAEVCAQGIRYAASNGADVLSNSWGPDPRFGTRPSDPTVEAAIDDAYAGGCITVFAAGNADDDVANYSPANYSKTIAVAATDYQDQKASFSNWGGLIDVAAPGVDVLSLRADELSMSGRTELIVDENYFRAYGTSMACPHVAGLIALLLSYGPYELSLGTDEIRQIIRDSADDLGAPGFDIYYGSGRINAYNALLELVSPIGRILLDSNSYSAPAEAVVIILDTDLNTDSGIRDTVTAELQSSTETTAEVAVLTEIEVDKGIFKGTILLEAGTLPLMGDGKLTVQHNDIITATYLEENPPGTKEATAVVDLQSPIIDSVQALSEITLSGETVTTIAWHTDERSNSVVYYGTTPSLGSSAVIPNYTTDHIVNVAGLELSTLYYFAVKSEDTVGNSTYDDNGGNLYQLTIIPSEIDVIPSSLLFETLEGVITPMTDTFTISNLAGPGSCDLLFEIPRPSTSWLSVSPDKGRISSSLQSMDIQITMDPARLKAGTYPEEITINHNIPSVGPVAIPVEVTALPAPAIHYKRYRIIDDWLELNRSFMVNGDGRFNPGERIELQIELENFGSILAQGVTAALSLLNTDPYITIPDDVIDFGDISPGAKILSPDHFLIEADDTTPDNHEVTFALDIADLEGHNWYKEFQIRVVTMSPSGVATSAIRLDTPEETAISEQYQISSDNNGNIYTVWRKAYRYFVGEFPLEYASDIHFNHSTDYGATWQAKDTRLDTDKPGLSLEMSRSSQICSDNNGNVYAVWCDTDLRDYKRLGVVRFDIYFNYSRDFGDTWQASDIRINKAGSNTWSPQISCDNNGRVYIVWCYSDNIYFNYSTDYGATWHGSDIRLDTDMPGALGSRYPQIASDNNGGVYVMWEEGIDSGEFDIYFNYSRDFGATWQADTTKLNTGVPGTKNSKPHMICDSSGRVYVVWKGQRGESHDIYLNYSNDYGATWQPNDIQINTNTPGTADSWARPRLSCDDNGEVYLVWEDDRNDRRKMNSDIYFNYSRDFGATWQAEDKRLDTDEPGDERSKYPQIGCGDNGYVYVVWEDARSGSSIYLNYSTDYGSTWQENDISLTTGLGSGANPKISCDDRGNAYVVWERMWSYVSFISVWTSKEAPVLSPLEDREVAEEGLLKFMVKATNSKGTPLELFFDAKALPQDLQDNLSNATFTTNFNGSTGETIGTFSWMVPLASTGIYYPLAFVARDDLGRCDYSAITITVNPSSSPVADFIANPTVGTETLTEINFTDLSTGTITSWLWNFGNGETSSEQSPTHIYAEPGSYTVTLSVDGPRGSDSMPKPGYITINPLLPPEIHYQDYIIIDDWPDRTYLGNGDGRFNSGERIKLQIQLENVGHLTAREVSASLSLTEPSSYVTIIDGDISAGDVSRGENIIASDAFLIEASNDTPNNHEITFALEIRDAGGGVWYDEFMVMVIPAFINVRLDTDEPGWSYSYRPQISSDNNGNVYAVWEDRRNGYRYDIYFNYSSDYGATWQESDIRLDTMGWSSSPQISSDNNGGVYVVWTNDRNGESDIYFNYSQDYGATWQASDIRLDTDGAGIADSFSPQISSDDNGNIYVTWEDRRNGYADIYFNYSRDFGATWQASDIRLDTDEPGAMQSRNHQISCDGNGGIYVVWDRGYYGYPGYSDIYFNYSSDYGATWQVNEIRINTNTPETKYSQFPQISSDNNGGVYVTWQDQRNFQPDIYFNYSRDFGATWLQDRLDLPPEERHDIRLDAGEAGAIRSMDPQISSDDNGNIYIAWSDRRIGYYGDPSYTDIYFNYSRDFGATWQGAKCLSSNPPTASFPSDGPKISCDDNGGIYVTWYDDRSGENDIYLNYSQDYGATWQGNDIRLDSDESGVANSKHPRISCDNNKNVYIVWLDERNGDPDIYFTRVDIDKEFPDLNPIADQNIPEGILLEFTVTTTNPAGTEVDLFFDVKGLSQDLQDNLSSAAFITNFNGSTGETIGTFSWTPDAFSSGTYRPVAFVVRTAFGRYAYQEITINVTDVFDEVKPGESIQNAIDTAIPGEIIYVSKGVYEEEDIYTRGKDVNIVGQDVFNTIIKGNISFSDSDSSIENMFVLYKHGEGITYSNDHYTDSELLNDAGITAINSDITVKDCIIMPDSGYSKYGKAIQIWNLYGGGDISPLIENNLILDTETGIYLFSQAFGGAILGEIKNNTLDLNTYGIVMRMHQENPLIQSNIITRSEYAIHLTYDSLLTGRLANIVNNDICYDTVTPSFNNTYRVWCDTQGAEVIPTGEDNIDQYPDFNYSYPDLDYIPLNPNCSDKGCRLD